MNDSSLLVMFAVALSGCMMLVTLTNTTGALVLLIFSMLLSPEINMAAMPSRQVVIRIDDLLLFLVFFTWLAKMAMNKQLGFLRHSPMNVPLGLFIASGIVSTGLGVIGGTVESPLASMFYFLKYLEYFLLFFMTLNIVQDRKQLELFVAMMLITAFIVAITAYVQMAQFGMGYRVSAPFEGKAEPNTLAGYLILMISVSIGLGLYEKRGAGRMWYFGLAVLMMPPLVFTYSRGGYLAFFVSYLFLCFRSEKHRPLLWALLVIGALLGPLVLPHSVFDRVSSTFEDESKYQVMGVGISGSPAARIFIWKYIWAKLWEHPFMGFGVTGIGFVDTQYGLVLGEMGLVGMAIYLWSRWKLYAIATQNYGAVEGAIPKGLCLGFLAGYMGLLVHSFTGNVFIIVRIMEPFWFLAALIMVLPELYPKINKVKPAIVRI